MEDFISILMGASLLGLPKTDIKQQTEPVLPLSWSVEDRCMGKWASSRKLLQVEREKAFISVNQRACTYQLLENWRWLSKEQTVNEYMNK